MKSLVINIKDDTIVDKVLWMLEHFKNDGLEIVSKEDMEALIRIRNYFGENDKTQLEHMAFDVLNRVVKPFINLPTPWKNNLELTDNTKIIINGNV